MRYWEIAISLFLCLAFVIIIEGFCVLIDKIHDVEDRAEVLERYCGIDEK